MVKLTKIYTRGGDGGETSLATGERRPKHSPRLEAIGQVDEANAAVGLARAALDGEQDAAARLARIQNDLFDLGADLATPGDIGGALRITSAQVAALEADIDGLNEKLTPLTSFVLPGGSEAAARLHMVRTAARRAERAVSALMSSEEINPEAFKYLNRLSDLMFQMARMANDGGTEDVLWTPGGK